MGLCFQDRLTAFALGAHLLGHDFLDGLRRLDVLQLHAGDLDAPGIGGFIQHGFQTLVDGVAAGEGLVKLHLTDDITESGGAEVLQTGQRRFDAVDIQFRIEDLAEHDGVDLHGDVILGDDRLGREVQDLFLQRNFLGDAVEERDLDVDSGLPDGVEFTETFHDIGLRLGNDTDVGDDEPQDQYQNNEAPYGNRSKQHRRQLLSGFS